MNAPRELYPQPAVQLFWRCAHHPSALVNFFAQRAVCQLDCHRTELRWHDNGTHLSTLAIWSERL